DPRKDFSQSTQPHITPSTSSAISPQQERTEPSGHRPCRRGVKSSLRREPDVPEDNLRAIFGNVTEPVSSVQNSSRPYGKSDCAGSVDAFGAVKSSVTHISGFNVRNLFFAGSDL